MNKSIKSIVFIASILIIGHFLIHAEDQKQPVWDGNRTTPVHRIPLKDELDQVIVPTESNPLPFSSRFTCAPCHDYNVIRQGLHFRTAASTSGPPGEPWVWVDEKSGTLLPLSLDGWPGTWRPEEVGLSAWDFTLLFGRHMAGGGVAEPPDEAETPASRWNVSGKVEINCLGCHNASPKQNPTEWAKQILRQNFRWAATAAAGLGEVGGMASRLGPTWDIIDGPNPDDTEWAVPPFVRYDRTLFDSKHLAFLDITRQPADSRCLVCHSVAPVGLRKFEYPTDVHTASGIACVSCHRHDISHAMIRGYEGEADDNPLLSDEAYTCAGCHLGDAATQGPRVRSGLLGAPFPRHKGFPPVHFERLACTVCHSGPWPEKELTRVRTSRANRLGIYGVARWDTDLPAIYESVYVRDRRGKLRPHRILWPAFWAEIKEGQVKPLHPQQVVAAAGKILEPEANAARILNALTLLLKADERAVCVLAGKTYALNVDGGLSLLDLPPPLPSPELLWAVQKNETIVPLIPDFDPAAESLDPDIESRLLEIFEALAELEDTPGKPALLYKNFLFQLGETYLEKSSYSGKPEEKPRLVWVDQEKIVPLLSAFEQRTLSSLIGTEQTLTEEQVSLILQALSREKDEPSPEPGDGAIFAYVSAGKMFVLDDKGELDAIDHPASRPVTWPLAHEVRPARQSLGVNGCGDCHRVNSSFLFRQAKGHGPLQTNRVQVLSANSFTGLAGVYQRLFGLFFALRPFLKAILLIALLAIGLILLLILGLWLGRLSGILEKGSRP